MSGRLDRQPVTLDEAVATADRLQREGFNASFGLGQVNLHNLARFGLDLRSVFDPCQNLRASAAILSEAYARARQSEPNEQKALRSALSMYYSGNPVTGRIFIVMPMFWNICQISIENTPAHTYVPKRSRDR